MKVRESRLALSTCDLPHLQDAEPQVLEPDKCVGWEWAPWDSVPQPVFLPLQLLLDSAYDPFRDTR